MKRLIVAALIGFKYYKSLREGLIEAWNLQLRKLKYSDGMLTEDSLEIVIKAIGKNLKHDLLANHQKFITLRNQYFNSDTEKYKAAVAAYQSALPVIKSASIESTLSSFGIHQLLFLKFLEAHKSSMKIQGLLAGITETYIESPEVPAGFSLISAVVVINKYSDLMNEVPEDSRTEVKRFEILDKIREEFNVNELDIYLALNIYKDSLAIALIKPALCSLESTFI